MELAARAVLAQEDHTHPVHVLRLHLLLHGALLLDDGDLAPDGEAVALQEPAGAAAFEGTGADEPGEAPGLARLEGGNLQALPVPAPERQQRPLVDQLELDLGMDGGACPGSVRDRYSEMKPASSFCAPSR